MHLNRIVQRLALLGALITAGCTSIDGGDRAGTATAQSEHAILLATQIGQSLQVTREAANQQAKATTAARQVLLEEAQQWRVLISDSFDENFFGWITGEQTNLELATMNWSITGGKYRWYGRANSGFVWWVTPQSDAYADFYLSASIEQDSPPDVGEYGLIFRQTSDDDYYLFEVNGSNEYALYLHSLDGWEALIDLTAHPTISTNAPNKFEVIAKGAYFAFNINDTFVADYSDERLSQGAVGILVGLANSGEEAMWEVDDFELRVP